VRPSGFLQIYTLNVIVQHSSIPCAYIVMSNRIMESYRRVFTVIRDHINGAIPASFMLDFESGM
jgi:hypothetical protein